MLKPKPAEVWLQVNLASRRDEMRTLARAAESVTYKGSLRDNALKLAKCYAKCAEVFEAELAEVKSG